MTPVERDVIRRKLDRILKCLRRIQAAQDKNLDDYLSDADLQAILERQLELAIGAAADINVHILTQSGFGAPADADSSFVELARHTSALSAGLAQALAPSTGLRNRLVHEYEGVDPAMVFEGLDRALDLFPQYVRAVETYLNESTSDDTGG